MAAAPPAPNPVDKQKAYYAGLHAALEDLYGKEALLALADDDKDTTPKVSHKSFLQSIKDIFKKKGYEPEMLSNEGPRQLIRDTYSAYKQAMNIGFSDNEVPEDMARRLDHDAFMFSGFKIHHELSEVGLNLRNEDGSIKSYDKFEQEALKVESTYNRQYLRSEYNFAIASSQMAVKWAEVELDGDDYDLQYRTAGDDRVREEHRELDGITLPPSDPFWDKYYPPNGWRCRCTTVQVRKDKYPRSDSDDAMMRGDKATTQLDRFNNNKAAIFRFNPGKENKVFPPKHPYLPKGCEGCTKGYRNLTDGIEVCCDACRRAWIERNRLLYEEYKKDDNYTDVAFNELGGVKACHKDHEKSEETEEHFFMSENNGNGWTGKELEKNCQNILFRKGNSCVLEAEGVLKIANKQCASLDSTTNGIRMDIRSITQNGETTIRNAIRQKVKQLYKFNAQNNTHNDALILYFQDPSFYSPQKIKETLNSLSEKCPLKRILVVVNRDDGYIDWIQKK